jgi:hypothetical protein
MRRRLTLLLGVLALSMPSVAQVTVAGDWMLTFQGPQGPIEANAKFTQDGETVSGTIDGPQGSVDVTGTLKESKLAIAITVDAGGQTITVYMLGDVEGDTMKGTWNFGQGSSDWEGRRKK